ncbi:MAG: aldo/keto reductase [Candidatus Zixiibacteriota bacterium]|nr:MAG: aldo/keto reductase [candidate division Zixibacteria bacterium]
MNYRRVGNSGMKISEIAIGAWLTYGKAVDERTTSDILHTAVEHGINFIDVADIYARGAAEEVVGKAIRDINRQHLVISSKVFWPMSDDVNDRGLSRKHIMQSIENSLRRLGTDYLDIYFCHRFDPETEVEEVVRAMDDLVHQGKVLYWGTSVWSAAQIERAVGDAARLHCYAPSVEQPRYNMLDRHIEPEIVPTCRRYGIGLTVWSPLAQGLLTGKYNDGIPAGSRGAETEWLKEDLTDANLSKVRQLAALASELGISVSQLALAWILRLPEISCAITGATKPEHVKQNVKAAEVTLDSETLARIEAILMAED